MCRRARCDGQASSSVSVSSGFYIVEVVIINIVAGQREGMMNIAHTFSKLSN